MCKSWRAALAAAPLPYLVLSTATPVHVGLCEWVAAARLAVKRLCIYSAPPALDEEQGPLSTAVHALRPEVRLPAGGLPLCAVLHPAPLLRTQ